MPGYQQPELPFSPETVAARELTDRIKAQMREVQELIRQRDECQLPSADAADASEGLGTA
jgi:hypothetical protein